MTSRGGRGLEIFSTLQYLMADFKFLPQTLALVSELGCSLFWIQGPGREADMGVGVGVKRFSRCHNTLWLTLSSCLRLWHWFLNSAALCSD